MLNKYNLIIKYNIILYVNFTVKESYNIFLSYYNCVFLWYLLSALILCLWHKEGLYLKVWLNEFIEISHLVKLLEKSLHWLFCKLLSADTIFHFRLSGFMLPSPIVSSGSILALWFTTDFAVSAQGFKAIYEGRKHCFLLYELVMIIWLNVATGPGVMWPFNLLQTKT